jgi:DivIVA domain-containing protein
LLLVEIDRQAIERRDFPIARRGYDPAAVDAHLRALASEMEELSRRAGGEETSLAASASSQVQSILQAAEQAAADIEREAQELATCTREEATRDARRTREEAIAKARAHLAAVAEATDALQQRVATTDAEVGTLLDSVRGSAERLAGELATLNANLGGLYDAASIQSRPPAPTPSEPRGEPRAPRESDSAAQAKRVEPDAAGPAGEPVAEPPGVDSPRPAAPASEAPANGDLDGARLVALNMALGGEPRAVTERYLAEHFQLSEREALIDEVYAAIEQ